MTKKVEAPMSALQVVRKELKTLYFERDAVIDGLLSALLCGQHVLLLGPPGSAKSALVQHLVGLIDGAEYFYWLLTKFSTPEEIFGPISLAGLQTDKVKRITTGKLPEAHLSFLDEIFKANSAILNSLLTAVNERKFHNDGKAMPIPLVTMIGASNELPEGEDLEALFDRFLLRYWVSYVDDPSNMRQIMTMTTPHNTPKIDLRMLRDYQSDARNVSMPDSMIDTLLVIKQRTEEQGFRSSDRRWRQIVQLLKAYAYLEGDTEVNEDTLEILPDALWREPKDRPQLASIVGTVGNPLNVRAAEILDAAKDVVADVGELRNTNDATAKSEWMRKASLADTSLTQMSQELSDLMTKNPKRNLRKIKDTASKIDELKKTIAKKVSEAYGI